jgi:hypothetical protein
VGKEVERLLDITTAKDMFPMPMVHIVAPTPQNQSPGYYAYSAAPVMPPYLQSVYGDQTLLAIADPRFY